MAPPTMAPVWEEEDVLVAAVAEEAAADKEEVARTVEVEVTCWPFDSVMMMVVATAEV